MTDNFNPLVIMGRGYHKHQLHNKYNKNYMWQRISVFISRQAEISNYLSG